MLKQVNEELKKDEELREKVNEVLSVTGHQYKGKADVKHFAQVLKDDIGLDQVKSKVEKPLEGLKVACHTGCHILSPPDIMMFDNPFDPIVLDQMISVLGAEPVDYDLKTLCCGWTLTNYGEKSSANYLIAKKLESMRAVGSDCITVICPQCFYQFDMGQLLAARSLNLDYMLPVLFYLQLLALAMGYSIEEVYLPQHRIKDSFFTEKLRGMLC